MNAKINNSLIESVKIEGELLIKRGNESNFLNDIQKVLDKYAENKKYNFKFW